MSFTSFILVLAAIGAILGLLMKYNKTVQGALKLNDPGVDKKYINYKINFLIVIGIVIIIIEAISIAVPSLSGKMDIIVSVFLLLAITIDAITKRKMGKGTRK